VRLPTSYRFTEITCHVARCTFVLSTDVSIAEDKLAKIDLSWAMLTNLVASIGVGLLLGRMYARLCFLLVPLLLLVMIGSRLQVLGLAVVLLILAVPIREREI